MGFDIDPRSDGAFAVNDYHAKCNSEHGPQLGRWTGVRSFYNFAHKHYDFCQEVLTETASKHAPVAIHLENLQLHSYEKGISFIRWKIARSEQLMDIYDELLTQFKPVIQDIARFQAKGIVSLGKRDFPEKPRERLHWTYSSFSPESQEFFFLVSIEISHWLCGRDMLSARP